MSHATEEDWSRREKHRAACGAAVCRSKEYRNWKLMLESESAAAHLETEDSPRLAALLSVQHPSPTNRSLNKRAWERAIQEWRKELGALGEFCP